MNNTLNNTVISWSDSFETKTVTGESTQSTTYYFINSELVAKKNPDSSRYYFHNDHLGSSTLITDSGGALVENTSYDPWGKVLGGGTQSKFLYTGQEKDTETNLNYYNARYYSSDTRRFTQPDDIYPDLYNPQTLNRYSYVNNNPLKYTDPTGHIFFMPLLFAGVTLAPTIIANANPIIIQVTEAMKSINRNPSPTNIAFNAADTGLNLIPSFKAVGTVGKVAEKVAAKLPVSEKIAEAIPKASKQTFHGNDLRNTAQTWGYTLRDRSTGAIKKIGETMHPDTRYSKKWLEANNVDLVHEVSGSKLEMHVWENQQLGNYLFDNLELPSLNKSLH